MRVPRSDWRETAPEPAVHRVLAHFGIPDSSIESIEPMALRATQQLLLVRAGGSKWVLKRQTSIPAIQRLSLSHPLEERLAEVGFPVARIQRTKSGNTRVHDDDACYSLHTWIEGQQVAIADRSRLIDRYPDLLRDLASTLGTLHQISGELEREHDSRSEVSPDRFLHSPRYAVRAIRRPRPPLLSRWHSLRLKRGKSEFDQWIIRALPHVAACAERLACQSISAGVGPSGVGVIHNDINWENLLFDEEFRLAALLDFDNAARAPWVLEVGAAAVVLAGAEGGRVDEFVSAYEDTVRVRLDRETVGIAMTLKCTQSILNSVSTYLNGNARDTALLASWSHHLYESLRELQRV